MRTSKLPYRSASALMQINRQNGAKRHAEILVLLPAPSHFCGGPGLSGWLANLRPNLRYRPPDRPSSNPGRQRASVRGSPAGRLRHETVCGTNGLGRARI